jgi:hypothetical protein
MVPPMVMLTVGDLYRDQPVLIQSITTTIPDDAAWETLNEDNSGKLDWNYLAKYIKAKNVLFGQLPRTIDIGLSLYLLEKERAVVGGANFGHAPRREDYRGPRVNTVPNPGGPNKLHQSLVVNVIKPPSMPSTSANKSETPSVVTPTSQPFELLSTVPSVSLPPIPYDVGKTNTFLPFYP